MTTDEIFKQFAEKGVSWPDALIEVVEWVEKKYESYEDPQEAIAKDYPTFNDLLNAFLAVK